MHVFYPIHPNDFKEMEINNVQINPLPEMVDNPYITREVRARRQFFHSIRTVDIENLAIDARITVKFAIRKMMGIGG